MSENTDAAVVARLLDGRTVSLRRLTGDDADAVVRLHERLNDQDRYFHFFTLHPAGLERLLRALVGPDEKHCAVGAFDGGRLIGVANYVLSDDPTVAEMAVVVAHEDHTHGVGTALLKHLAHVAAGAGIRRFTADVLAETT